MTDTTCGNLHLMFSSRRQRRSLAQGHAQHLALGLTLMALVAAGCGGGAPAREPVPNPSGPAAGAEPTKADETKKPPIDDDVAAERYLAIKDQLEADPGLATGPKFPEIRAELEGMANGAAAKPLRANAALLLGSLFEDRVRRRGQ